MVTYTKIKVLDADVIQRDNGDGTTSFIPVDEANSDYQAYLAHLTESVTKAK